MLEITNKVLVKSINRMVIYTKEAQIFKTIAQIQEIHIIKMIFKRIIATVEIRKTVWHKVRFIKIYTLIILPKIIIIIKITYKEVHLNNI